MPEFESNNYVEISPSEFVSRCSASERTQLYKALANPSNNSGSACGDYLHDHDEEEPETIAELINISWRDAQVSKLRDHLNSDGIENIRRLIKIL